MAVRQNEIVGFDAVMSNLDAELRRIQGDCREGLLEAGVQIEAVAKKRVPVEYGNLRASGYSRFVPEDEDLVEVGFGAAYALFVHDSIDEKLRGKPRPSGLGTYWNPGESHFLEGAIEDNLFAIVEIVKNRAEFTQ